MCGIFGVIDPGGVVREYERKLLAALNVARGHEGTGLLYEKKGRADSWKTEESVLDVLAGKPKPPKAAWSSPYLLGHTRRASLVAGVGGVKRENAHPFKCGNIIGAHNGYISNWKWLQWRYDDEHAFVKEYNVDSQMAIFLLNLKGPQGLSEIEGKAAIWWIDVRERDVAYLWCWKQDLALSTHGGTTIFSSERGPLDAIGAEKTIVLADDGQLLKIGLKDGSVGKMDDIKAKKESWGYSSANSFPSRPSAAHTSRAAASSVKEDRFEVCDGLGVIKIGEKVVSYQGVGHPRSDFFAAYSWDFKADKYVLRDGKEALWEKDESSLSLSSEKSSQSGGYGYATLKLLLSGRLRGKCPACGDLVSPFRDAYRVGGKIYCRCLNEDGLMVDGMEALSLKMLSEEDIILEAVDLATDLLPSENMALLDDLSMNGPHAAAARLKEVAAKCSDELMYDIYSGTTRGV